MQSENAPEAFRRLKKEPTDFSSGLKLPKLESMQRVKARKGGGSGDNNAKVRNFKESRKNDIVNSIMLNAGTTDGGDDYKGTGLFRRSLLESPSDIIISSDSEDDIRVRDLKQKVKGLVKQRKKNRLDHEIHSKISNAFDKMEIFEKGIRSFDDTLHLTKTRFAESGKKSNKSSPRGSGTVLTETLKLPNALKQLSQHGLKLNKEEMKVKADAAGSGGEAMLSHASDDSDSEQFKLKPKLTRAVTNLTLGKKWSVSDLEAPESNANLAKPSRSGLLKIKKGQELRQKLQILNSKFDQSGQSKRKTIKNKMESVYNGEGNLTRLMAYDPNKGPAKEFTDFMQTHGGATGGWDKEDHDTFLTVFLKWRHRPTEVVRLVSKACPERQLEDIAAHLEWYEKYETLNAANKTFVQQWNIQKTLERQQMYKMAKEDSKAKIEGQKSHHELVKARREAEREREKMVLNDWKKSKKPEIKKLEIENDLLRDPDGPTRTIKLGQSLQMTKEKLVKLLPPTHQVRQVLTKSRLSLGIDLRKTDMGKVESNVASSSTSVGDVIEQAAVAVSPTPSSGVFSESPVDNAGINDTETDLITEESDKINSEIKPEQSEAKALVVAKRSDASIKAVSFDDTSSVASEVTVPVQLLKRTASEKMLAFYRSRDESIVVARRNAIQRKENQKRKGFLSTEEAKQRISKIKLPSQVTRMTKGIEMRQNLRQLEAIEATVRQELKQNPMNLHRQSRVPTPQLFKPGPTLTAIPKLGTPSWRAGNS